MRLILLFALLLFLHGRCYADSTGEVIVQSQRHDKYTWDFGKVKENSVLKHDFIFTNTSSNTITIKGISTSCGCTASKASKEKLSLGESAIIEVTFNTKGYYGNAKQFVYLDTDDVDNPIVRFIIKAEIVK